MSRYSLNWERPQIMKTKKRNILLTLAMMMGLLIAMSTVASADDEGPTAWESTNSLPTESGTYYLEDNVSLEDCYDVPSEAVITIDLNGKEISGLNGDKDQILILVDGKLTITDTKGNGRIESHNAVYTIWVSNGGEFNLSGGLIDNYDHDTAVYSKNATINISGGEIEVGGVSLHIYAIEDDGGSTIMVSGGTFLTEIKLGNGTTFTATGGEFRGGIINNGASFSLSGGIYSDPDGVDYRDWVSDGFTTVYIGDGYSEVVKGVSSITLEKTWMDVTEGERKALQATVLPEDAYNRDVIWSSDNEAVATVSDEGVVFGKSCGEATITAKPDGQPGKNVSNDELTATCDVTVYPDIWWKKADNTLYLRAGQKEGYRYHGEERWGAEGYSKVIVENTIRPVEMTNWFNSAADLEEIVNPENIDTSRVTSMKGLFDGCRNLRSVDMSSWDTSSVTDMGKMFQFCNALTTLDLTSFDVSKVEKMASMFWSCTSLQTIFVSDGTDWTTQARQLTDSGTNMFNYCRQLTGGNGTSYDESKTDVTYARVDGGTESSGYFVVPLKVTFEDGTGNVIASKNARYGGSVIAPENPTRNGYVFDGWDPADFSNITSALTVKAKWKEMLAIPTGMTLTYTGKSQTGVAAGTGFILSGTTSATNTGSYQAKATLEEGYVWNDGTSEPKTINWTINKAISKVTAPTGKTLTYNGKSQIGVAADVGYTLTGTATATNAGSYTSTATLNTTTNYAYIWADGSTSAKTIKWKINKAAQSITKVTPASKTYKAVKKTKKLGKTYKFTLKAKGKGSGKVTFKKANKAGASKITVSKAGKVTIKKGLKKGTYKVKVKASKAANTNYTAVAKTVIVKIIVK